MAGCTPGAMISPAASWPSLAMAAKRGGLEGTSPYGALDMSGNADEIREQSENKAQVPNKTKTLKGRHNKTQGEALGTIETTFRRSISPFQGFGFFSIPKPRAMPWAMLGAPQVRVGVSS